MICIAMISWADCTFCWIQAERVDECMGELGRHTYPYRTIRHCTRTVLYCTAEHCRTVGVPAAWTWARPSLRSMPIRITVKLCTCSDWTVTANTPNATDLRTMPNHQAERPCRRGCSTIFLPTIHIGSSLHELWRGSAVIAHPVSPHPLCSFIYLVSVSLRH
jgi:hypothetical protein